MCSLKRVIFKVPQKLQKKNLVGVPFLIKMQVSGLQLTTITQLLAQIIQRSTKHSAYSKSCANHSTLLKSIQHCNYKHSTLCESFNHSKYWKSWNNCAGFINIKVQWKTNIAYTNEACQNYPLYNSIGNLWSQTL